MINQCPFSDATTSRDVIFAKRRHTGSPERDFLYQKELDERLADLRRQDDRRRA